jgi:hypothetical protein
VVWGHNVVCNWVCGTSRCCTWWPDIEQMRGYDGLNRSSWLFMAYTKVPRQAL